MLQLEAMRGIQPRANPAFHRFLCELVWRMDYWKGRRTRIVVEGEEHVPTDERVVFAMNHTDRFNFCPLLIWLHQRGRYCGTWVKGKYYESAFIAGIMQAANQIPIPSWSYLLASRFRAAVGRRPSSDELGALLALADGVPAEGGPQMPPETLAQVRAAFGGDALSDAVPALYAAMMGEVVRLNTAALEAGLDLLVFPEGTRSRKLSRGRPGMVQIAGHLGLTIVPVGCNGSDLLYPGDAPLSKGGTVTLRFGAPLRWDQEPLSGLRVDVPYQPLGREDSRRHAQRFQAQTDAVLARIAQLLDARHLPDGASPGESDGVKGVQRFI